MLIFINFLAHKKVSGAKDDSKSEMADFEEVKIPVPWGHISGKWWGPKDIQPILATHGWQDNCGTFDALAPYLINDETSILAIDFPGHGHSSHIPEGMYYYLFWDGILNFRRIVKHFKWQKVRLMGHSLGGAISFLYAGTYPDEVEFIVSLDVASPVVKKMPEIMHFLGRQNDRFLFESENKDKNSFNGSYDKMVQLVEENYLGSMNRKSTVIMMRRGLKLVDENKRDRYGLTFDPRLKTIILSTPSLECCMDYAKRIKCGYLNIRAKNGMKIDDKNSYEIIIGEIEKVSSKFQFVKVEGTHHVHLNNPTSVAPIIQDFIKSYPPIKILNNYNLE